MKSLPSWLTSERTLMGVLAIVAVALVLSVRATSRAARTVYYIPSADRLTVGQAQADRIPQAHVAHFARAFVSNLENYTPATVEGQLGYVRTMLAPAVLARQEETFLELALYSTRGQISSHLVLDPASVRVEEARDRWRVTVEGAKTLYTRGRAFRSSRMRYQVELAPGVVSRTTPDGLYILGLTSEILEEKSNEPDRP